LRKTRISISDAYFSAVETEADFFNRIGRKRSVMSVRFWPIAACHEGLLPAERGHGMSAKAGAIHMELPRHASSTSPQAAAGAFSPVVGRLTLPASEHKPVQPSRGDAELATSPFGSGRPVRPWLVVNPGEGTAAPWASWPQPSSENNFPCAARIPRGKNCFRFQVLHGVATAARCGQPIPRRPDHNKDALARPCSTRKEKHHG
jgi:hypothetical protein